MVASTGVVLEAALVELGLVCTLKVVGLMVVWVVGKVDVAAEAFWVGQRMLMLAALVLDVLLQLAFDLCVLKLYEASWSILALWRQRTW